MRPALTRVFHCPKCNRIIRTTVDRCKYCSAPIDRMAAEAASEREDLAGEANVDAEVVCGSIEDAAQTRTQLNTLMIVAAPVYVIRWLIRYRHLDQGDPELAASKRSMMRALGIWVLLMIVLYDLIARRLSG